jgi:hypothetical protein
MLAPAGIDAVSVLSVQLVLEPVRLQERLVKLSLTKSQNCHPTNAPWFGAAEICTSRLPAVPGSADVDIETSERIDEDVLRPTGARKPSPTVPMLAPIICVTLVD